MQGHDLSTEVPGNPGGKGRCSSTEQHVSPEPTTVPRWKDGQEFTQHHKTSALTDRYPGSAPEAREGVKASKAEIRVYLPRQGQPGFWCGGSQTIGWDPRNKY